MTTLLCTSENPMITIPRASIQETPLAMAQGAAAACVRRLRQIRRLSDPHDPPLKAFLKSLVRGAHLRVQELREFISQDPAIESMEGDFIRLQRPLRSRLPSLSIPLGEGFVDRETGTYLVECLKSDLAAFHQNLADRASDDRSMVLYRQFAQEDLSALDCVRNVVLPPAGMLVSTGNVHEHPDR